MVQIKINEKMVPSKQVAQVIQEACEEVLRLLRKKKNSLSRVRAGHHEKTWETKLFKN